MLLFLIRIFICILTSCILAITQILHLFNFTFIIFYILIFIFLYLHIFLNIYNFIRPYILPKSFFLWFDSIQFVHYNKNNVTYIVT